MITNPFQARQNKVLTDAFRRVTLVGGAGGHDESTPEATAAYSADNESGLGDIMVTALDALLDMYGATVASDRESLDKAYENLITAVEGYRDACPKA